MSDKCGWCGYEPEYQMCSDACQMWAKLEIAKTALTIIRDREFRCRHIYKNECWCRDHPYVDAREALEKIDEKE